MNKVRIEISSEDEAKDIIKTLEREFTVTDISRMYKKRNEQGYYIYLNIESRNLEKAGRKNKLTEGEKIEIKMYRCQGMTLSKIAESYDCSIGLIHKILNEN